MKTFETITKWIIVLSIAVTVAVVSASEKPITNHVAVTSTIITNAVRETSITNIVIKSDNWIAVTDMDVAGITMRIPVTEQGRTNIINTLVESGEFCRVRGHTWNPIHGHFTLLHRPSDALCRECFICKAHQERQIGEWK